MTYGMPADKAQACLELQSRVAVQFSTQVSLTKYFCMLRYKSNCCAFRSLPPASAYSALVAERGNALHGVFKVRWARLLAR